MTTGSTDEPARPQVRNPAADPDTSPEKQSELKLNVGIGVLGTILSAAVAVVFFLVLEEHLFGIVFAVVALVSAAITVYAFVRRRRGQRAQQ